MIKQPWIDPIHIFEHAIAQCLKFGVTPWEIQATMMTLAQDIEFGPADEPPPFRVIYPPELQHAFRFDVVGPTARRFSVDFEPGKTARMLASGFKTWSKYEAG